LVESPFVIPGFLLHFFLSLFFFFLVRGCLNLLLSRLFSWFVLFTGKYTDEPGSIGCIPCATGYHSPAGQSACRLADDAYCRLEAYSDTDNSVVVKECPDEATCAGGYTAPAPKQGYWSDRSR